MNVGLRHRQRSGTLVIPYPYEVRQRPIPLNISRPLGAVVGLPPGRDSGRPTGLRTEDSQKDDGLS
jgi:hypothetical protein